MAGDDGICLKIAVLQPGGAPFRGEVDIELRHQTLSDLRRITGADARSTIAISGLHRTPQGLYQLTVTPSQEFKPKSQFVVIPASGATVVDVRLDASETVFRDPIRLRLDRLRAETTRLFAGAAAGIFAGGFGHYDSPHGDSSPGHLDFGHIDSGHIDFFHGDGYSDAAHDDLFHADGGGHDDSGHDDSGHDDSGHDDSGHDDSGHDDSGHDDSGHDDGGGHEDEGHGDDGDKSFLHFGEVIDEIILLQQDVIQSVSARFTNLSREFTRTLSGLQSTIKSLETEVQNLRQEVRDAGGKKE